MLHPLFHGDKAAARKAGRRAINTLYRRLRKMPRHERPALACDAITLREVIALIRIGIILTTTRTMDWLAAERQRRRVARRQRRIAEDVLVNELPDALAALGIRTNRKRIPS
jgi:hypothetical protein